MCSTLATSLLAISCSGLAAAPMVEFTVTGGKADQAEVVVSFSIAPLAISPEEAGVTVTSTDGKSYLGQLTGKDQLNVLIPHLKAGQTLALEAKFGGKTGTEFTWKDPDGSEPILLLKDRPLLRYVRPDYDPKATPGKKQANANPTFKVYHHLYASDGKTLLTNGAGGSISPSSRHLFRLQPHQLRRQKRGHLARLQGRASSTR